MLTTCTQAYVSFHVNFHYSFSVLTKTETGKFYQKSTSNLIKLDYAVLNLSHEHKAKLRV